MAVCADACRSDGPNIGPPPPIPDLTDGEDGAQVVIDGDLHTEPVGIVVSTEFHESCAVTEIVIYGAGWSVTGVGEGTGIPTYVEMSSNLSANVGRVWCGSPSSFLPLATIDMEPRLADYSGVLEVEVGLVAEREETPDLVDVRGTFRSDPPGAFEVDFQGLADWLCYYPPAGCERYEPGPEWRVYQEDGSVVCTVSPGCFEAVPPESQ